MLWMAVAMMAILWFILMYRPGARERKEREAMLSTLKKNDEVITIGGIVGTVVNIREKPGGIYGTEDEVTLRLDDKTRVRVLRSSIARVYRPEESPAPHSQPSSTSS